MADLSLLWDKTGDSPLQISETTSICFLTIVAMAAIDKFSNWKIFKFLQFHICYTIIEHKVPNEVSSLPSIWSNIQSVVFKIRNLSGCRPPRSRSKAILTIIQSLTAWRTVLCSLYLRHVSSVIIFLCILWTFVSNFSCKASQRKNLTSSSP